MTELLTIKMSIKNLVCRVALVVGLAAQPAVADGLPDPVALDRQAAEMEARASRAQSQLDSLWSELNKTMDASHRVSREGDGTSEMVSKRWRMALSGADTSEVDRRINQQRSKLEEGRRALSQSILAERTSRPDTRDLDKRLENAAVQYRGLQSQYSDAMSLAYRTVTTIKCSKCGRTPAQIQKDEGISFQEHLAKVGGTEDKNRQALQQSQQLQTQRFYNRQLSAVRNDIALMQQARKRIIDRHPRQRDERIAQLEQSLERLESDGGRVIESLAQQRKSLIEAHDQSIAQMDRAIEDARNRYQDRLDDARRAVDQVRESIRETQETYRRSTSDARILRSRAMSARTARALARAAEERQARRDALKESLAEISSRGRDLPNAFRGLGRPPPPDLERPQSSAGYESFAQAAGRLWRKLDRLAPSARSELRDEVTRAVRDASWAVARGLHDGEGEGALSRGLERMSLKSSAISMAQEGLEELATEGLARQNARGDGRSDWDELSEGTREAYRTLTLGQLVLPPSSRVSKRIEALYGSLAKEVEGWFHVGGLDWEHQE